MATRATLLPGTLDRRTLRAVSRGTLRAHGVLLRIQQISNGSLHVQQGALYPVLSQPKDQALLDAESSVLSAPPVEA